MHPSYSGGRGRRITVQDQPRKKLKILSENKTKSKRTKGMAKVVHHLPRKCETLSSFPSTVKNKN
jgi:hypothetical protein